MDYDSTISWFQTKVRPYFISSTLPRVFGPKVIIVGSPAKKHHYATLPEQEIVVYRKKIR